MSRRSTILDAIVAAARKIVEDRRADVPLQTLERAARRRAGARDFAAALTRPGRLNVVAECKRRSPARGILRRDYDVTAIARAYEAAGAAAISVLTEPTFFDGSIEHLDAVHAAVSVPVLRKDFVVDEYQLAEARAMGADAVLLIVAALGDDELRGLLRASRQFGLFVLVEVHDEAELDRALLADAGIVGVNNRDLKTLEVDLSASTRLIGRMPRGVVAIAESGLKTRRDLEALRAAGYDAFLIGERLMTAADPGAELRELLGDQRRFVTTVRTARTAGDQ